MDLPEFSVVVHSNIVEWDKAVAVNPQEHFWNLIHPNTNAYHFKMEDTNVYHVKQVRHNWGKWKWVSFFSI